MAGYDTPSVRERRLAGELRLLRASAQLQGKDVAAQLGWSPSKVSRIETGRIGISRVDLERLLSLYDVPDDQAAMLRRLAPSARPKGWWDAYADTLSPGYAHLIRLEAGSRALRCYCALVPHALLQTPRFTRTLVESTWQQPSTAEVDRRVQVVRRRQSALDVGLPEPLELAAVVDEAVLRRSVRGPDGDPDPSVTVEQLDALVEAASRPNVTIQVLPFTAGLLPVTAGSFAVLESRATETPDVVYLENRTRISFIDAEPEVYRYARDFQLLAEMALSPTDSVRVIREARKGYAQGQLPSTTTRSTRSSRTTGRA
jgi:transcriptional regulator with XRE-family HTH domain